MTHKLRHDQRGMVAILITMIMMIVITLIVLGFSEVTRRNQREALDTQLGLQAYYAAESGVNAVVSKLKQPGVVAASHPDCSPFTLTGGPNDLPLQIAADGSVANTCLIIDATPAKLVADTIAVTTDSVVWHVQSTDPGSFESLTFSWKPDGDPTLQCTDPSKIQLGKYLDTATWTAACNSALLRVDILKPNGATDAAGLAANTTTLYLQPGYGEVPVSINDFGSAEPAAHEGACNVSAGCYVTVNLAPATAQSPEYYVRLTAAYHKANNVTLSGKLVGGATAHFKDGQVVIDSTGRAQDQLKRIRVRIPLTGTSQSFPVYAVQSAGSTCKDMLWNVAINEPNSCAGLWPGTP